MNASLINITAQQLRKAATLKEQIENLEHELQRLLGGGTASANGAGRTPNRRMSAAGRATIAAGARARWAKIKRGPGPTNHATKPRRKMSAAAKARLAAIARARWRKAKAAGKSAL
jgi:hypothetical protein